MKALLLVAHGSRRAQSNDEVRMLADRFSRHCSDEYDIVQAAFLELADPLIPAGIHKCIDAGASSVVVLPYFLNSGRHVIDDIPAIVDQLIKDCPGIDIRVSPHLGASEQMMDVLVATAQAEH